MKILLIVVLALSFGLVGCSGTEEPGKENFPKAVFRDYGPDVPRRGRLQSTVIGPKSGSESPKQAAVYIVPSEGFKTVALEGDILTFSEPGSLDEGNVMEVYGAVLLKLAIQQSDKGEILQISAISPSWKLSDGSASLTQRELATNQVQLNEGEHEIALKFETESAVSESEFVVAEVFNTIAKEKRPVEVKVQIGGGGRNTR